MCCRASSCVHWPLAVNLPSYKPPHPVFDASDYMFRPWYHNIVTCVMNIFTPPCNLMLDVVRHINDGIVIAFVQGHLLVFKGFNFLVIQRRMREARAPSQYPKRRLSVRSRKVSKPRDLYLELADRSEIWQALRQQCCRCACQISKRYDNLKYQSRGFETLRDLMKRRLFTYWYGAQVPRLPIFQEIVPDQIWERKVLT